MSAYSLILTIAILISAYASWRSYNAVFSEIRFGRWVDVCLCALVGAILVGRTAHVALNWTYFSDNLNETWRLNAGGMDGLGALVGGVIGAALGAKWRRLPLKNTFDALTWALPLLAFAGWSACAASGGRCGFGREIQTLAYTSPLIAAELPDVFGIVVPRYQTQLWGAILALCLLAFVALCFWRGLLVYRRFWLVLILLILSMGLIGAFRG
jgi:prolipoprotein diacylglyceryltransferase